MAVSYTTVPSPVGAYVVAASPKGLVLVERVKGSPEATLRDILPASTLLRRVRSLPPYDRQLREYFRGDRRTFRVPVDPAVGTPFQRRVWRTLTTIPYGETRSYGWVARSVGRPGASRAVGQACGRNPVAIVVPCHRVVSSAGRLGGYTGGVGAKRWLLRHEATAAPDVAED